MNAEILNLKMREKSISSAPDAFNSEYLAGEFESLIQLPKEISNHDQRNADESWQVEQAEIHDYRHRHCEAV